MRSGVGEALLTKNKALHVVVVKTVNKHATCSDQQNDFFFFKQNTYCYSVSEDRWLQIPSWLLPRTQTIFISTHSSRSVYVGLYCSEHDVFSLHMFIELLPFHGPSERFICVAKGFVTSETSTLTSLQSDGAKVYQLNPPFGMDQFIIIFFCGAL